MGNFFNAFSKFLESDLAKSYGWVLLMTFIFGAVIVGFLMNLIYMKIFVPEKLIESNNIAQEGKKAICELEEVKSKILKLEEENEKLKEKLDHFKFAEAIEDSENEKSGFLKNNALRKFM